MKTITAFQTSDEEIFPDKESAERHQFFLSQKELIEQFLESNENPYRGLAHLSMARGSIVRWELWKTKNAK